MHKIFNESEVLKNPSSTNNAFDYNPSDKGCDCKNFDLVIKYSDNSTIDNNERQDATQTIVQNITKNTPNNKMFQGSDQLLSFTETSENTERQETTETVEQNLKNKVRNDTFHDSGPISDFNETTTERQNASEATEPNNTKKVTNDNTFHALDKFLDYTEPVHAEFDLSLLTINNSNDNIEKQYSKEVIEYTNQINCTKKNVEYTNQIHCVNSQKDVIENVFDIESLPILTQLDNNILVPIDNIVIEEILVEDTRNLPFTQNNISDSLENHDQTHFDANYQILQPLSKNGNDSNYHEEIINFEYDGNNANQNLLLTQNEKVISHKNVSNSSDDDTVFIRGAEINEFGDRKRIKIHCCYFCNKLYKDLGKHIIHKHTNELEVAKLLLLEKKSEERRKAFLSITRAGDYYHNCEVLKKKCGELILARMPTPAEQSLHSFHDYSPCPRCLGFMLKKHLWHHVKYGCCVKEKMMVSKKRQIISESTSLLVHTFTDLVNSGEFLENIVIPLKDDLISMVCRQDKLIVLYGASQFEKYHTTQNELIRQSMRQLARLLIQLRKMDATKIWLSDWLRPKYFDNIVSAVKNIAGVIYATKARPQFDVPSLALKLGYALRKCIGIQRGLYLRNEDLPSSNSLDSFLAIMDLEWSIKISSSALSTMNMRKMNVIDLLPLTEDLVQLNNFINENLNAAKIELKKDINLTNWSRLASLTLSKIILFNKRRSGEASRLTLNQYSSRPNTSDSSISEFKNSLSAFEIDLASKLAIVQIIGKRGRIVNILLTNDTKEAIDLLISHRSQFMNAENPYVFSRSNPSKEYLRGHDCLRNLAFEANLTKPELVNATKLRKYIATVCQIFDLNENETDWLARHLGHDIRVHREFYRLHDSSVELAKVSRILLAVENGKAHQFKGKKLSEINICGKCA